ncbi:MAG: glutathione S-transferase family protein [Kofleriaceae bacterium]|nr:glutathione S-transferase family protein [Kofleriaceae bacterium]
MISIRSTQKCVNTPGVLFALEEAGVPYTRHSVPDGYFTERYGIPGPAYIEGEGETAWTLVEVSAIYRHIARAHGPGHLWPHELRAQAEVDRWIDFVSRRVSRAVEAVRTGGDPNDARALLARLETRFASGQEWMVGPFTVADCLATALRLGRPLLADGSFPHLVAYLDRLAARPAYARAFA